MTETTPKVPLQHIDAILVPSGPYVGTWVRDGYYNLSSQKRLMEMIVGRATILAREDGSATLAEIGKFQVATDEDWNRMLGLVICGLAQRVTI